MFLLVVAAASRGEGSIPLGEAAWGDSKAAVLKIESLPFHHELPSELAFFDGSVPTVPGGRKYLFEEGALARVEYVVRRFYRESSAEDPFADFDRVKEWLELLFGPPMYEEWVWDRVVRRRDTSRLQAAIRDGSLEIHVHYQRLGTNAQAKLFQAEGRVRVRAVLTPAGDSHRTTRAPERENR